VAPAPVKFVSALAAPPSIAATTAKAIANLNFIVAPLC
jgi:hypothetical protein